MCMLSPHLFGTSLNSSRGHTGGSQQGILFLTSTSGACLEVLVGERFQTPRFPRVLIQSIFFLALNRIKMGRPPEQGSEIRLSDRRTDVCADGLSVCGGGTWTVIIGGCDAIYCSVSCTMVPLALWQNRDTTQNREGKYIVPRICVISPLPPPLPCRHIEE